MIQQRHVILIVFLLVALNLFFIVQIPSVKAAASWVTPDAVHSCCGTFTTHTGDKAIDELTDTYWKHDAACLHWIIFDMGKSMSITKIHLYQYSDESYRWGHIEGLSVYVSDDLEDFGDAVWEGILNAAGWQESGVFEKSGRYIKLVSKSDYYAQRMYEFDAYAETVEEPSWNLVESWNFNLETPSWHHVETWTFNLQTPIEYVTITLATNPSGLDVRLDSGVWYIAPHSYIVIKEETYLIECINIKEPEFGKRYVWVSWSDAGANPHPIYPLENTTYTATYKTQYFFNVDSAYDTPMGEGWYDDGSGPICSTVTTPSEGYQTTGWTGTGSLSSGGTVGSNKTTDFWITQYTTCTWNWQLMDWHDVEIWSFNLQTPAPPLDWHFVESWSFSLNATAEWRMIETWSFNLNSTAEWRYVESWSFNLNAIAFWQGVESWSFSLNATAEWNLVETWMFNLNSTALWRYVELWMFNLENATDPTSWHHVETWNFNLNSTSSWHDIEDWQFNLGARRWREVESWHWNLSNWMINVYGPFDENGLRVDGLNITVQRRDVGERNYFLNGSLSSPFTELPYSLTWSYSDFGPATSTNIISQYGLNFMVYNQSSYYDVLFSEYEDDTNYTVDISLTWNSTYSITNKTTTGFRVNFDTPPSANEYLNWYVYRTATAISDTLFTRYFAITDGKEDIYVFVSDAPTRIYDIQLQDYVGLASDDYLECLVKVNGTEFIVERRPCSTSTIPFVLKLGGVYTFRIISDEYGTYVFGVVTPGITQTINFMVNPLDFPHEVLTTYRYVQFHAYREKIVIAPYNQIIFKYNATKGETTSLKVFLLHRNSTVYYAEEFATNTLTLTIPCVNGTDYMIKAEVQNTVFGSFGWSKALAAFGSQWAPFDFSVFGSLPIPATSVFAFVIVLIIAGAFSTLTSELGVFLAAIATAFFVAIGWLPLSPSLVIVFITLAVIYAIVRSREKKRLVM